MSHQLSLVYSTLVMTSWRASDKAYIAWLFSEPVLATMELGQQGISCLHQSRPAQAQAHCVYDVDVGDFWKMTKPAH